MSNKWRTVGVYGSLFLMVCFAVFFGLVVFGHTSLRLDEAQSLFQTQRDIPGMLNLVAQDVHVPGYHTLLHFWQLLFGQDIYVARILSLIFFVVLVPVALIAKMSRKKLLNLKGRDLDTVYTERNHAYTAKDLKDVW